MQNHHEYSVKDRVKNTVKDRVKDSVMDSVKGVVRAALKPVLNWANVCSPEHTSDTSTNYDSFLN